MTDEGIASQMWSASRLPFVKRRLLADFKSETLLFIGREYARQIWLASKHQIYPEI